MLLSKEEQLFSRTRHGGDARGEREPPQNVSQLTAFRKRDFAPGGSPFLSPGDRLRPPRRAQSAWRRGAGRWSTRLSTVASRMPAMIIPPPTMWKGAMDSPSSQADSTAVKSGRL